MLSLYPCRDGVLGLSRFCIRHVKKQATRLRKNQVEIKFIIYVLHTVLKVFCNFTNK